MTRALTLLIILLCYSCGNFDQVEKKYENYKLAEEDHLFERGWIANGLIFESMEAIYLRSNLDINTYFYSYKLSDSDFEVLKKQLKSLDQTKPLPNGINIPNRFNSKMKTLNQFSFIENDSVYVKVDDENKIIYAWN